LKHAQGCELQIIAGGMHFQSRQGSSIDEITADGFSVTAEVVVPVNSDDAVGMTVSFSEGVLGMSAAYERLQPDLVVLLGDRFEMFAAAIAAVFAKKPLAHLHGGELTLGAVDDVMRHSMTKMSHLHFASTACHAARIVQMGEEPWRVHVSGALALDNLKNLKLLSPTELQGQLGFEFEGKPLVVTFHPPTLENIDLEAVVDGLLESLVASNRTVVITAPNADPGGEFLHRKYAAMALNNPRIHFVENLGTLRYFSLMRCAAAMIGNSSSGILEAASFGLPVVNIGSRQEGRLQPPNVINCGNSRKEIGGAIAKVISEPFGKSLKKLVNPYGMGNTAECIAEVLLETTIDERLMRKKFHDVEVGPHS
jgi:UDP-hydrolysing UDP-N-acetyl-D-glucosamine 2-epimerase